MGKEKQNRRLQPRRSKKADGSGGPIRTGMARDIAAVLLLALGVAAGLALTTFSSIDGALITRHLSPANLIGPVGHRAAAAVYRLLGFAALVVPCGLITVAWRLFRGATGRFTALGALAYIALTLCLATLSHLLLAGFDLSSFPAGGAVGSALAARSVPLVSTTGSVLLVAAAATVALIVATGVTIGDVAALAWHGLAALAGFIRGRLGDAVQDHREAVADMRAEEQADRGRRAEADALAAAAFFEGAHEADRQEARAVAGALALEQVRRPQLDEPAWVDGLVSLNPYEGEAAGESLDEPEAFEPPRRKRKKPEPQAEALEAAAVEEPPPTPTLLPPPPSRPEIVVPAALLERSRKKKEKEKKEVPSFAFTKAGDVFQLPSIDLLDVHEEKAADVDKANLTRTADVIVATLAEHGIDGQITYIRPGPVVTLYEFLPVGGTKLARIENLNKELTMALAATRIRIIAPIPGKGVVGIEVPNNVRGTVFLRDILESETFGHAGGFLPLGLGKDIEGTPYCIDLQKMPHLLIAGTTGAGKSVGLNTMILSMLFRQTPAEVRMIMVDPKMTELSPYEDIPHLLLPVVTDPQKASRALQWAVDEMERRTQILADTGVRDLKSYNARVDKHRAEGTSFEEKDLAVPPRRLVVVDVTAGETEEQVAARLEAEAAAGNSAVALAGSAEFADPTAPPPADPVAERDTPRLPQKLPYIVVIIDELADLMMTAPREVETSLARLAAKARATGIHLVVATQRPSTDVVTGTIKNNFPARISFRLGSRHDSTTIINGAGAESLLGNGDMLVMTATQPLTRVQGAFVSEEELKRVVDFLKLQGRPVYDDSILKARDGVGEGSRDNDLEDPVYDQAMELVAQMDEVSVSKLQREMRLGYNKAAKIIGRMEREGLVGPPNGVKPRQVLMRGGTPGEYEARPNL